MTDLELQHHFQKVVMVGGCVLAAVIIGLLLAGAPFLLVLTLAGAAWLLTLPYHASIALFIGVVSFNSAFIIPAVPGRPFWWELAAMLGWSGVVVTLALRRQSPGSNDRIRQNWPLFMGVIGFSLVLVFLMYYRGVGIRVLSGGATGQMGGRLYLQQLACGIFLPLLAIKPLEERLLVRLFIWQCLLSFSFLLSDFVFSAGSGPLFDLLIFLELPNDGLNFEMQSLNFGIRRFQSLFVFTFGILLIVWTKRPFRDYANTNGLWLWPVTLGLIAIGMLSGHRQLVYTAGVTAFFMAWSQRFFSVQRMAAVLVLGGLVYFIAFAYAREMPLSAQRALSVIPGIEVDRLADEDGRATFDGRAAIRKAGWEVSKQYRLIGRGFGKLADLDPHQYQYDMTYLHVDNGVFYNGTIGLLVNTGLPGTFFMFLVLAGGSALSFRILRVVRRDGADDDFLRFSGLQASVWLSNTLSFIFLHGDAEFALRGFAMPAGLMIAAEWHLRQRRVRAATAAAELPTEPTPELIPLETVGTRA